MRYSSHTAYIYDRDLTREGLCSACADTALLEDEELEHAQIILPVEEVGMLLQLRLSESNEK